MVMRENHAEKLARLSADVPPDAGGPYGNQDGLVRWLEKQPAALVADTAQWVSIHYTETEPLLVRLRALYRGKSKSK